MESFKAHESYITQSDWRVKENSNNIDSFGAYQKYLVGEVNAEIMRQVYGQDLFKHHDEGFYHIHDISSGLCNYCFGGSLETLFSKGISGVANLANSSAPEHFDSACNQIASSILGYASEISGAVAYSSINTYLAPFVRRDKLLDSCKGIRAMRQSLQNLIFNLNQNTRFSSEPCFSNFTLDLAIPVPLRNKPVICGSDNNITTYGEYEEEAKAIALMLLDIMLDGDTKGNSFTYPLITVNIASQEDFESPVIESASELSAKTGNCYFANFINSSLNANDTYSLCPLTGDTEILTKSVKGYFHTTIQQLVGRLNQCKDVKVFTPSGWKACKPVVMPKTKVYRVKFSNGASIDMGENHLHPVKRKGEVTISSIPASELVVGDLCPATGKPINDYIHRGSKDLGFVVGCYMGNGSHEGDSIIFSQPTTGGYEDETIARLRRFLEEELGYPYKECYTNKASCNNHRFNAGAYKVVSRFITGDNAHTKRLTSTIYDMGSEFFKGFLEGMQASDGARACSRYYTVSKELRMDITRYLSANGQIALAHSEDSREGRLTSNVVYRIDNPQKNKNYKGYYASGGDDGHNYYYITSIEEIDSSNISNLYCLEVDCDTHLFMLSNGMFTHNCRLRIDKSQLIQKQGLFGAQANTGSIGVVTLSLPMIARKCYENNDDTSKFLSAVKGWAFEAAKVLIRKRKVITERFDAGFYPHLKQSLPRGFATFFSTIGLIGMAEAYEILTGLTYTDNANSKSFATSVIDTLNEVASICQELPEADGALFNVEASPAESACFSLARKYNKVYNDNEDDRDNIPYFTNSSNLSVDKVSAIWRGAKFYDNHLSKYTGGSVFHILCDDKKITGEQVIKAVKHLFSGTDIPYVSITPTMYRCEDHGHSDTGICKECGKECETLTRITGYVRSVGRFNTGKLLEHGERKYLDLALEIERY